MLLSKEIISKIQVLLEPDVQYALETLLEAEKASVMKVLCNPNSSLEAIKVAQGRIAIIDDLLTLKKHVKTAQARPNDPDFRTAAV